MKTTLQFQTTWRSVLFKEPERGRFYVVRHAESETEAPCLAQYIQELRRWETKGGHYFSASFVDYLDVQIYTSIKPTRQDNDHETN